MAEGQEACRPGDEKMEKFQAMSGCERMTADIGECRDAPEVRRAFRALSYGDGGVRPGERQGGFGVGG